MFKATDFMLGDHVIAELGKVQNKKGMITSIFKDKLEIMDLDTKIMEIVYLHSNTLKDIPLSDIVLSSMGFEERNLKITKGINEEIIKDKFRMLTNLENQNEYYFITAILDKDKGYSVKIEDKDRNLVCERKGIMWVREFQHVILTSTRLPIC